MCCDLPVGMVPLPRPPTLDDPYEPRGEVLASVRR